MAKKQQKLKETQGQILARLSADNLAKAREIIEAQRDALGNVGSEDAAEARAHLAAALNFIDDAVPLARAAFENDWDK